MRVDVPDHRRMLIVCCAVHIISIHSFAVDQDIMSSMESRLEIRLAIQQGHIEDACRQINEMLPTLLDDNQLLHFHLLVCHCSITFHLSTATTYDRVDSGG